MGIRDVTLLHRRMRLAGRAALVLLWLITGVVSLVELNGQGRALMVKAGTPDAWIAPVILAGAAVDLLIGLAMWRWHRRWVYRVAGAMMLVMTAVATVILPSLWLDPLGSLTKNLPVAALLLILHADATA